MSEQKLDPKEWFEQKFRIIGVIHLLPLPGSPGFRGSLQEVIGRAVHDAKILEAGGVDAVVIENFGDKPFRKYKIDRETLTAFTIVAYEVKKILDIPVGINVLRNGGVDALRIAYTVSADFIRVNIPIGTCVTPEGQIEGIAAEINLLRKQLGTEIKFFEDVLVKHSWQVHSISLEDAVIETINRGLADVIIVTGARTGLPPDREQVLKVKENSSVPVVVGSGITPDNISHYIDVCDGIIVGSWLKKDGITTNPVDPTRLSHLVNLIKGRGK